MTFEAPQAIAGTEPAPVLTVFNEEAVEAVEATNVEQEVTSETEANQAEADSEPAPEVTEPIADGDGMSTVEIVEAKPATDDTFWQEIELLGQLGEAERERQEASNHFFYCKEQLKEAKELMQAKEIVLQQVASKISDLMLGKSLPRQAKPAGQSPELEGQSPELSGVSPELATEASETAWRDIPIRDLLAGVRGLGAKKLDSLCDMVSTAGALEDLRATSGSVFKTVLPSGFGDKVASAIEDALLAVQTPPAGRAAGQVEPRVVRADDDAEDDELADDLMPVIAEAMDTATKLTLVAKWDEFRKKIEMQNEIELLTDAEDCNIQSDDSVQMDEGFKAFEADLPVHACDGDTPEAQNDWVFGWCLAKRRHQLLATAAKAEEAGDGIDDL